MTIETRQKALGVYKEMFQEKNWADLTSLDKMSLFIALEDEFGVSIDQDAVDDVPNIYAMLDKVEEILR